VFKQVKEIRRRLPFGLLEIDADNGGEFINCHMLRYCTEENLVFTRGRPYRKNDGAHIEQKNWTTVRQTVGYGRFETQEECDLLNEIYDLQRLINNFFMPSQKPVSKTRDGSCLIRKLDEPKTPYQRVMLSEYIDGKTKEQLAKLKPTLNPVQIRRDITRLVDELYSLQSKE